MQNEKDLNCIEIIKCNNEESRAMKKNIFISSFILIVLVILSVMMVCASDALGKEHNPYIDAYLADLAEKGEKTQLPENVQNEVFAALNSYYQKDLRLSELIAAYVPGNFDTALIYSVEKDDKIAAMHMMESVYEKVESEECRSLIYTYFLHYANDSGDKQAIAFFEKLENWKRNERVSQ